MITTLTPPASALFAVDDAALRQQLRIEAGETDSDALLAELIATATTQAETYTRRRLLTQTVRLTLDGFGCGWSRATPLPIAPVQSVDQVQYMDDAGEWVTLPDTRYRLIDSREPPELRPAFGQTWPVPKREPAVVRIDLVVGYGAAATAVPPAIVQAVRMIIAHLDMHRGAVTTEKQAAPVEMPFGVRAMLDPHRIWI